MVGVEALQALEQDEELQELKEALRRFNLFEALGIVRREIRHSRILAFLLNPRETHELGDAFYRAFLSELLNLLPDGAAGTWRRMVKDGEAVSLDVRREWRNIDILAIDSGHGTILLIENKIDHIETEGQLEGYYDLVAKSFPGHTILPLFLTPRGRQPKGDQRYYAVPYRIVNDALRHLQATDLESQPHGVRTFISHYQRILRLHIMGDPEISEKAWRIYHRHKGVFEFILNNRHYRRERIEEILKDLITQSGFELGDSQYMEKQTVLRFYPQVWDDGRLKVAKDLDHILYFEFVLRGATVYFCLTIHPGDEDVRARLWELRKADERFTPYREKESWPKVHRETLVEPSMYERTDLPLLEEHLRAEWVRLSSQTIPRLREAVEESFLADPPK